MADNYLEKRYSEVFGKDSGKKASPGRPSLDTLLARLNAPEGFDPSYKVHSLQLEAITTSARKACNGDIELSYEAGDSFGTITVSAAGAANPQEAIFKLGAITQTIALKAAELGLKTEPRLSPELNCIISVGKTASK